MVTKYVPSSVIAWASVPHSPIETSVLARFKPLAARTMRLDVDVSYCVVHTGLGDAVRALVSPRSTQRLHAALQRARFYLESLPVNEPTNHRPADLPAPSAP